MFKRAVALYFLIVVLLAGCASHQLYHRQLVSLNKGMTPEQATASLQIPALSSHQTTVTGNAYTFQKYYLHNGLNSDVYLLCYENGKLKYWGYIDEFRRYPDTHINQALENVLPELRASNR